MGNFVDDQVSTCNKNKDGEFHDFMVGHETGRFLTLIRHTAVNQADRMIVKDYG